MPEVTGSWGEVSRAIRAQLRRCRVEAGRPGRVVQGARGYVILVRGRKTWWALGGFKQEGGMHLVTTQ